MYQLDKEMKNIRRYPLYIQNITVSFTFCVLYFKSFFSSKFSNKTHARIFMKNNCKI